MYNLYTKFVKILEICKQFSENLVNESGNVPRRGPVPKFSDLEVVALSLTAETESIDSEKWLFDYKLQEYKDNIPNLISRRQFNDRRKKTAGLCEELRKRIAMEMDGGGVVLAEEVPGVHQSVVVAKECWSLETLRDATFICRTVPASTTQHISSSWSPGTIVGKNLLSFMSLRLNNYTLLQ